MGEEVLPSGMAYTYTLLNKWEEIMKLSEIFRENFLARRFTSTTHNEYVAKLTRLWLELYPKLKDNSEHKELAARYEKFKPYYSNPLLLTRKEHAAKVFEMEEIMREALEKLNVTRFEEK